MMDIRTAIQIVEENNRMPYAARHLTNEQQERQPVQGDRMQLLMEMSFDRKVAEQKIRGREETLNEHLVTLLAFNVREETRTVWKKEIAKHLRFLAALRVRPKDRTLPAKAWFEWLYSDPFQGNEIGYTQALIEMHADDFERNDVTTAEVGEGVRRFHEAASQELANGTAPLDQIPH